MSEQKHTPEPWHRDPKYPFAIMAPDGEDYPWHIANVMEDVNGDDAESEANAERIVACVNGCAGIADPSGVNALRSALGQMVRVFNVNEIDPLAAFVTIEYARAALDRVEGR